MQRAIKYSKAMKTWLQQRFVTQDTPRSAGVKIAIIRMKAEAINSHLENSSPRGADLDSIDKSLDEVIRRCDRAQRKDNLYELAEFFGVMIAGLFLWVLMSYIIDSTHPGSYRDDELD